MNYSELKIGQKVKVVRKIPTTPDWGNSCWAPGMDSFVNDGIAYTVKSISKLGACFEEEPKYDWPWQSLELAAASTIRLKLGDIVTIRREYVVHTRLSSLVKTLDLPEWEEMLVPRMGEAELYRVIRKYSPFGEEAAVGIEHIETKKQFAVSEGSLKLSTEPQVQKELK